MNTCQHEGCNNLVDIDPWIAYPNEYTDVPHLCDKHVKPFEETIRNRFTTRRERARNKQ